MGKSINDLLGKKTDIPVTNNGKQFTISIPDPEPMLRELRFEIDKLAKQVKEVDSKEFPTPKDYTPELNSLNKELDAIKGNIRAAVLKLSLKIDDIGNKPQPQQKEYSGELGDLNNQLDRVKDSIRAIEGKADSAEPLKQDIKTIKGSIDDLYKNINSVISAMNNLPRGKGGSTYVLEQRGGGSGTGSVNKTDYTAKGDILAGSAVGAPTVLPIGGTTGYVLSVDPVEVTGMKWVTTPSGTPSGTAVALTAYGASSAAGTSAEYARGDHSHGSVADIITGTAHATLATGVHGAGTATIATTSDITIALTATVLKVAWTAKGSLLAGSAVSAPTSLAIGGTTGYVLSVDAVEVTGMKWIASPAGTPSGTAVALTAYGASSAAGTSSEYARGDHSHGSVADIVSGTAHATLATGVHGAGTATIATTSDITTHAGLTGTHGAGTIESVAGATALITTHAGSTDAHIGGAGTVLSKAAATVLITTHAGSTDAHIGGAGTVASVAAVTAQITTHAGSVDPHNVYPLKTAWTAKGSLMAGSAASAPTALAIGGTAGYVLTIDSAEVTGMKWATAGAGTPSGTAVALTTYGASSAAGTSAEYARGDHSHGSVADIVSGTAHATLATGVHGAGTAVIATTSDITTALTTTVLKTAFTAKGSILAGSAVSDPTSLAVAGTNGYVLQVDSTQATGLKWASAPAGTPADTAVALTAYGASSAAGTSAEYSRGDHSHGSVSANTTLLPKQMVENDPLLLDAVLSATGKYSGIVEAGTSDAALLFGQVCYLTAASTRWALAAATSASGTSKLGICVAAATGAATTTSMLLFGKASAGAFPTLTVGAPVFLSNTAGSVVVAAPTAASSVVRVIGYGNAAGELAVHPAGSWIELGASGYTPSGTIVAETTWGASSAVGASATYARGDHTHGTQADPVSGTAHATLATGVHGAGTATIATTSDITTHAALTSVHSLGSASTAASAAVATTALYQQKQMAENDPLLLDPAISATGQYSGIAIAGTSDAALVFGQVCYQVGGSARWGLAAATVATGVERLGICVQAATGAATITTMLLHGNVCAGALTACALATAGSAIYISNTAGSAVMAAPTTGSSIVRVIGHSLAASTMIFIPDGLWVELA